MEPTPTQQNFSDTYTNGVKNPVKLVQGMSENKHGIINKVTDLNVEVSNPPTTVIYGGWVNSDGTPNTPFPTGWTSTVGTGGSVGRYTITHNLGTTSYVVTFSPVALGSYAGVVTSYFDQSANSFTVAMINQFTGTPTDTAFQFQLLVPNN